MSYVQIVSPRSELDETIILYSKEINQAKLIVLKYKGIKLEYISLKEICEAKFPKFKNFKDEYLLLTS